MEKPNALSEKRDTPGDEVKGEAAQPSIGFTCELGRKIDHYFKTTPKALIEADLKAADFDRLNRAGHNFIDPRKLGLNQTN